MWMVVAYCQTHILSRLTWSEDGDNVSAFIRQHTHTHNRFTALLEYVRDHPGEQVPER